MTPGVHSVPGMHDWRGPTPAMVEDDDHRSVCKACGARGNPAERRWTRVALLFLPLSPSALHEVTEWLSVAVHEQGGHELVVTPVEGEEEQIEAGYWQVVRA